MVVGIITSAISGWLAVWGLLRLVRSRTFSPFVAYRFALAAVVWLLMITGVR
jgi:undecaprenyl-diphosphatase